MTRAPTEAGLFGPAEEWRAARIVPETTIGPYVTQDLIGRAYDGAGLARREACKMAARAHQQTRITVLREPNESGPRGKEDPDREIAS
jgi:hypothetical protein